MRHRSNSLVAAIILILLSAVGAHATNFNVNLTENVPARGFTIEDSTGALWLVQVSTSGALTVTPASPAGGATASAPILQASDNSLWQEGVSTSGALTTTSVSVGTPVTPLLVDSSGVAWAEQVSTSGALQTSITTLDAITGLKNCRTCSPLVEGHVTTDSVGSLENLAQLVENLIVPIDRCTGIRCVPVGFIEGNVTVDSVTTVRNVLVNLSETLTTTDAIAITKSLHIAESEAHATVDSLGQQPGRAVSMSEIQTTVDTLNRGQLGELTVTLTTSATLTANKSVATSLTETLTLTAIVSPSTLGSKNVAIIETHSTVPSVVAAGNHPQLIESLTTIDSVSAQHCFACSPLVEGHVTNDSVTAIHRQEYLVETLTESDTIKSQNNKPNLTETLTESDSIQIARSLHGSVTETLTTSDGVIGIKSTSSRALSETLTTTDSLIIVACTKFPIEILTTTDTVAVVPAHVGNMTDTLAGITDAVTINTQRQIALSETVTESDALGSARNVQAAMTETLATVPSVALQGAYVRSLTEIRTTVDQLAASHVGQQFGTMSETLSLTDFIVIQAAHVIGLTEINSTVDSLTARKITSVNLTETLIHPPDLIVGRIGQTLTEILTTSSSVQVSSAHLRNLSETLQESDAVLGSKTAQQFGTMAEFVAESDQVVIRLVRFARKRFLIIDSP